MPWRSVDDFAEFILDADIYSRAVYFAGSNKNPRGLHIENVSRNSICSK